MQAVADEWRPDVIVRETAEFASYIVAERNGIPQVQAAIAIGSLEEVICALVDEPLRTLGSTLGSAGLRAAPRLTLVPPSLEVAEQPARGPVHRFRFPSVPDTPSELPREWWADQRAPLVYVTFGSVAAGIGFGTTLLGLSAGLPMVVVPLFALAQYANARRIEAMGAGLALADGPAAAAAGVRQALERVLADSAYRHAAQRLADEMARLPHSSECVSILRSLSRTI
jgi:UDP:flavonoid glycosyltransferase YjiC (YdhE family)